MFGVNFQYRAFLLMPLLCLRLFQVHGHVLSTWYDIDRTEINGYLRKILIECQRNESLNSISPTKINKNDIDDINETKATMNLSFLFCSPPNKPYLEILKKIKINASKFAEIWFREMADTNLLKESLFEGMSIKKLKINGYEVIINSTGKLDLTKGFSYTVDCYYDRRNSINTKAIFPNRSLNVRFVIIKGCSPPNESYSEILRKLNIIQSSIEELKLEFPAKISLQPDNFKGLSIQKLSVKFLIAYDKLSESFNRVNKLDPKVFQELDTDEVYLEKVELKTLRKFRTRKVTMAEGKFIEEWVDCSTLTSLNLISFITPHIHGGWLHRCVNLTDLALKSISKEGVEETLLGAHALNTLSIEHCGYTNLTKPFAVNAVNLRRLKIKEFSLSYVSMDAFSALKKLEELDLSGNRLTWSQMVQAVTPLGDLRKLTMDGNPVDIFCNNCDKYMEPKMPNGKLVPVLNMSTLSLRHSPLSDVCFSNWVNLTYLDLSYNRINRLQLTGIPAPNKLPLTVDLRGNPLKTLPKYDYYEFKVMVEKQFQGSKNITILMDSKLECHCQHTWYGKALRELPQINFENATCTSGERLVDFTGEKIGCKEYPCDHCTCRTSWDNGVTTADCDSRTLYFLPAVSQLVKDIRSKKIVLKKILASRNFIETLPEYNYPNSLVEIDLSNNKISRVSENALRALFFGGNRSVYFSGNPFVCDCETQAMLDALSLHRNQIPDYKNLTCSNRDSYLHELSHRSFCIERLLLTLGTITAILLALVTSITLFYFRFKLTIKAFLYAKGLCLFCVREEELDADKEYDAFIAFASVDDELVAEVLLPGLENDYKICTHTRNWIPGEMIYTQIVKSVEESKRTIIVLSKNFVESLWGMLEFRTAYVSALREGRVRVICIVVDDVINNMELDPDLKAYLKSNTYLNLKDPWFWQKLRYALPHPCVEKRSEIQNHNRNGESNCQEIELAS